MNKTYKILTFGCKVNSYESEAISEELEKQGYVRAENEKADIYIVNTCAVTQMAEKKDMEKIRSIARNFPEAKIVALGCFAQLHPERIEQIPEVKVLVGSSNKNEIIDYLNKDEREIHVDKESRKFEYEDLNISEFVSEVRAFVKIQDGCDNFCSYCVIPLTRGKSRSRKKESVLAEIKRLADNGEKEIVITGIDTGSFNNGNNYKFSDLIEDILKIEPASFRLRISSLETTQIDDKLINLYKTNSRLVPHIHLPLQSGCQRICEAMNRKYDLNEFYNLTLKLKEEIPHLALSTDVIVGFPSESESDFEESKAFIEKIGFMRLHVFPYSKRPFTKAYYLPNQVDRGVSKNRVRVLNALGKDLLKKYEDSLIGEVLHLLVEEVKEDNNGMKIFRGYTENYLDLKVESSEDLIGKIVEFTYNGEDLIKEFKVLD